MGHLTARTQILLVLILILNLLQHPELLGRAVLVVHGDLGEGGRPHKRAELALGRSGPEHGAKHFGQPGTNQCKLVSIHSLNFEAFSVFSEIFFRNIYSLGSVFFQ